MNTSDHIGVVHLLKEEEELGLCDSLENCHAKLKASDFQITMAFSKKSFMFSHKNIQVST